MASRKVCIVGAGLAGLSAGIHLQQQGFDTEIFELAGWAGGMCTAWVRRNYRFDGCIHWMVGTRPGDEYYKLFREVDALAEDTVIFNAESIRLEVGGVMYDLPMTIAQFKEFLYSLSPSDRRPIDELCKSIEAMMKTKMPAGAPSNFAALIKVLRESGGFLRLARKYMGRTMKDLADDFQSATIQSILYNLMPTEFSAVALILMLGTRMSGNAGYPIGGALDVIRRVEAKYRDLGGKIHFLSKVDKIVVNNNGRAVGVQSKGVFHATDAVIAACDAYDTLANMLGGEYKHEQLDTMLESGPLFSPLILVSYGLKQQFDIPYSLTLEVPNGIDTTPDITVHTMHLRSFDFDETAAPSGCSSVMVTLTAPCDYWHNLRNRDMTEYRQQKQRLANTVATVIEQRFPGFKDAIEVIDVATPATYIHLTNVYKASFEGFLPTPAMLKTNVRKTIPGVQNLVLCGQWTEPGGGICTAVASGKGAARRVMKAIKPRRER